MQETDNLINFVLLVLQTSSSGCEWMSVFIVLILHVYTSFFQENILSKVSCVLTESWIESFCLSI